MTSDHLPSIRPDIANLPASEIRKVARLGQDDPQVIPLWFGESDHPTPHFIKETAEQALMDNQTFYCGNNGLPQLRTALSKYLTGLYAGPIDDNRITVTGSGMQAVMLTIQMLAGPGDNLVVVGPVWPNIASAARIAGAEPRFAPLDEENGRWSLDMDRLFNACDGKTKAVIVNTPSNPTGWIMPRDQQQALLDFAREKGLWIVSDEVYGRIVYDGTACAPSFLELASPDDPVIVVNSFSKAWRMTGWRLGWVVAPPALEEVYAKLTEFNISCQPPFVQLAGTAALRHGESAIQEMMSELSVNRALVRDRLARCPRVRFAAPGATFYGFFSIDGMHDSVGAAKQILNTAKVGLAPGRAFGPAGEGYMRLCFAIRTDVLAESLDRLVPALNE